MHPKCLVFDKIIAEKSHQFFSKMRKFLMTSEFLEDLDATMNQLRDSFYRGIFAFQAMIKS